MSKKILVRGLLVGAEYDDPIFAHDIANGIFCPSSKVLRDIEEANGEDLELYIDSEGGDVFAWNSCINALKSYPGNVTLIVDACAFSEAANLVLLADRPTKCHSNTIMLWHSAMTPWLENAAPGELRSEAAVIDAINAPIKQALRDHGVPEDEIEDGFKDGSSLVMGADDLVRYGIATLIDDNGASLFRVNESLSMRIAALADAQQRIAARFRVNKSEVMSKKKASKKAETEEQKLLEEETQQQEPVSEEQTQEEKPQEEEAPVEETQQEEAPKEEQPQEETQEEPQEEEKPQEEQAEETQEEAPQEEEKPQEEDEEDEMSAVMKALDQFASNLNTITANLTDLNSKWASIEKRLCDLEGSVVQKEAELADAKKALKAERTRHIGAIAKAITGTNASESTPVDWPAAVKACNGDKMAAYKKWPELAKAWAKQPNN